MDTHILSVYVNNRFGVLTRISGLFARRGYNIKSLTVGETENADISRMTIEFIGNDEILTQIKHQLAKVEDVITVKQLNKNNAVCRELFLIKIAANDTNRASIIQVGDIFRAKAVDISPESITYEITGDGEKLEAFYNNMKPYGILEVARTGITALERGKCTVELPIQQKD